jgi:hypothetical protein
MLLISGDTNLIQKYDPRKAPATRSMEAGKAIKRFMKMYSANMNML